MKEFKKNRFLWVFLVLWFTYSSYTMARRPFSVARADIQKETRMTTAQSSIVDSVFMLTYTIGQFKYGYFKKYLGNKDILFYGIICSSLASLLMAISSSLWIFCIAWSINGITQAAGWATCLSILNVWIFPEERGKIMGWWSTNMAVGGVIGNIFPAFLIGQGLTWRLAVSIESIILFLVSGIIYFFLIQHPNVIEYPSVQQLNEKSPKTEFPRIKNNFYLNKDGEASSITIILNEEKNNYSSYYSYNNNNNNNNNKIKEECIQSFNLSFWQIIKLPGVCGICTSYFIHKLVRYGFMFWLPYFAVHELKYSTEFAGYVTSAFDIGGVIGTIISGYTSDWLFNGRGRTRVLLILTSGMIFSTLLFGIFSHIFIDNTIICTLAVGSVGFFSFAIDALLSGAFLLDYLERVKMSSHAGVITGVVGGMGSAGSIFQGFFTILLTSSSWSTLFYSFSMATAVAGLCLIQPLHYELKRERRTLLPV